MAHRLIATAFLAALALTLTACGKKEDVADPEIPRLGYQNSRPVEEPPPEAPKKKSSADKSTPLEKFSPVQLNDENRDIAYIYFAVSGEVPPENDLLDIFSARYFNEADVFKKKDIAATEKPRILKALQEHKQMRYIVFSLPPSPQYALEQLISPYDMNQKGFPLGSENCLNTPQRTLSNVALKSREEHEHCFMPVADIDLAKKIEASRSQTQLRLRTLIYAYVEEATPGSGTIELTPIAMRIQFMDGYSDRAPVIADLTTGL